MENPGLRRLHPTTGSCVRRGVLAGETGGWGWRRLGSGPQGNEKCGRPRQEFPPFPLGVCVQWVAVMRVRSQFFLGDPSVPLPLAVGEGSLESFVSMGFSLLHPLLRGGEETMQRKWGGHLGEGTSSSVIDTRRSKFIPSRFIFCSTFHSPPHPPHSSMRPCFTWSFLAMTRAPSLRCVRSSAARRMSSLWL